MTNKSVSEIDGKLLPEGTTHHHGTFYSIPFAAIRVPGENSEEPDENGEYRFSNPRTSTESGAHELLFGKKAAAELRASIKKRTLLQPLVCRWQEEGDKLVPVLVGGDRRYRAVDWLIKNKEQVADPRKKKVSPDQDVEMSYCLAKDAYETLVCQIFSVQDDLEALAISWAENKNRINLTDGHEVAEVIKLRKHRASDTQILEILQRDEKWLAETDRLVSKLDAETLSNLIENRIDRHAALALLQIPDQETRKEVLEKANDLADEKHKKKKEKAKKVVTSALDEQEEAEGLIADYEFSETQDGLDEAKHAAEEASQKVRKSLKKLQDIQPITTTRDVNKAKSELSDKLDPDEKLIRCLSARKINLGIEYLSELIRDEGVCQHGNFKADVNALNLVIKILKDNVLANDVDFAATLEEHYAGTTDETMSVLSSSPESLDPEEDEDVDSYFVDDDEDFEDEA